jgi:hypothetical protein
MAKNAPAGMPHSWGIEAWPADVHPNSPSRARYLIRTHRDELMAAGALVRVGRELVVLGARYSRWLERQASRVPDFEIAPNRERSAA